MVMRGLQGREAALVWAGEVVRRSMGALDQLHRIRGTCKGAISKGDSRQKQGNIKQSVKEWVVEAEGFSGLRC